MFMPIILESLGNTLPEDRSFIFRIFEDYYSDRGESTMNAIRKVRFWLKKWFARSMYNQ